MQIFGIYRYCIKFDIKDLKSSLSGDSSDLHPSQVELNSSNKLEHLLIEYYIPIQRQQRRKSIMLL